MLLAARRSNTDSHPICVRLFGHPQIHRNGLRIDSELSAQALLLFALLVTRKGETLNREEVAFTLWPDLGESEARAALRRQLYRLQQVFPASNRSWLDCSTKTVAWCSTDETWVDVVEFERLSESHESLEAAAELYAGEFAPYLDHEWATNQRERLRRRGHQVFEQLVEQRLAAGDTAGALHYVERLLVEDPWREDRVRQLMTLRFHLGDRAGALSYYRNFRERLRSEFDVDPMPETVQCHEKIARGLIDNDRNGNRDAFVARALAS